jgi:hypothetical protein
MPLVLKMATPQKRSWSVLQLAKKESVTSVQRAFRTQFHVEQPAEYPFTPGTINSSRKGAFAKTRVLVGPLCLMQLWTVFGLASSAAHKNQPAICSYHKQPSPESCESVYLWNRTNFSWSRLWNQKIWPYELDYRVDICRVTRRAHVESLWGVYKTLIVFLSTSVGVKF